jgi:competence ComEA-like helix-hairpin-helix protein
MRAVVHLAAALALTALAFAVGRWLRDPEPGGPLIVLLAAAAVFVSAVRRLYGPGGLGRRPVRVAEVAAAPEPEPVDDRIDLNAADAAALQTLPGIGPVGARRIVEEREEGGPFASVGELTRVTGFGPGRAHALQARVRVCEPGEASTAAG